MVSFNCRSTGILSNYALANCVRVVVGYGLLGALGRYLLGFHYELVVINSRGLGRVLGRAANYSKNEGGLRGHLLYVLVYVPNYGVYPLLVYVEDGGPLLGQYDHVRFRGQGAFLGTYRLFNCLDFQGAFFNGRLFIL